MTDFPSDFREWAVAWAARDKDYVRHRAKFATEPVRSIAKLIIIAAEAKT